VGGGNGQKREGEGIRREGSWGTPKLGSNPDVRNPKNSLIADLI